MYGRCDGLNDLKTETFRLVYIRTDDLFALISTCATDKKILEVNSNFGLINLYVSDESSLEPNTKSRYLLGGNEIFCLFEYPKERAFKDTNKRKKRNRL